MFQVIVLFRGLRLVTSGATGVDNVYERLELDVAALRTALFTAESAALVSCTVSPSAPNLEWNVELRGGFDRDHEAADPLVLAADITASGPLRSSAYTTQTSFLPHTRAVVRFKNKTGVAGVLTGVVDAYLIIKKPS